MYKFVIYEDKEGERILAITSNHYCLLNHSDMIRSLIYLDVVPVKAGFMSKDGNNIEVYGKSISLSLDSEGVSPLELLNFIENGDTCTCKIGAFDTRVQYFTKKGAMIKIKSE